MAQSARFLLWLAPLIALTAPASGAAITLAERLAILERAYPDTVATIADRRLLLTNGKSLVVDDGARKSHRETLQNADIEDMLSQIYPLGACLKGVPKRNFDPGRLRSDGFFRAVYGQTKTAAQKQLTDIDWFGRKLRFTTVIGADKALMRVRDDLSRLGDELRKYFLMPAGTFNWRTIAGTARLSMHSFGAAIDIAIENADYWRWAGGKPGDVPNYRNKIPLTIVEIFERHGFIWGGRWYHFDSMHFEFRPELIALGRLALQRGCPD